MTPPTAIKRLADLADAGRRDVFMLDPSRILVTDGHNPRDFNIQENKDHVAEIKESARANGIKIPLEVRYQDGQAVLVDGECRLRAALELREEGVEIYVPVLQIKAKDAKEMLLQALIANTGKPLTQIEKGTAYARLVNYGWTPEMISERLGHPVKFIKDSLELYEASPEIRAMVSDKEVTPALAVSTIRKEGPTQATTTLKAKVTAAKAKGKKTATRDKINKLPSPKTITNLVIDLISGAEGDVFNSEYQWIEVDRRQLAKLASLVGIKEKE